MPVIQQAGLRILILGREAECIPGVRALGPDRLAEGRVFVLRLDRERSGLGIDQPDDVPVAVIHRREEQAITCPLQSAHARALATGAVGADGARCQAREATTPLTPIPATSDWLPIRRRSLPTSRTYGSAAHCTSRTYETGQEGTRPVAYVSVWISFVDVMARTAWRLAPRLSAPCHLQPAFSSSKRALTR